MSNPLPTVTADLLQYWFCLLCRHNEQIVSHNLAVASWVFLNWFVTHNYKYLQQTFHIIIFYCFGNMSVRKFLYALIWYVYSFYCRQSCASIFESGPLDCRFAYFTFNFPTIINVSFTGRNSKYRVLVMFFVISLIAIDPRWSNVSLVLLKPDDRHCLQKSTKSVLSQIRPISTYSGFTETTTMNILKQNVNKISCWQT